MVPLQGYICCFCSIVGIYSVILDPWSNTEVDSVWCHRRATFVVSVLLKISIVLSRTNGQTQRLIVCGAIAGLHLLFLYSDPFANTEVDS